MTVLSRSAQELEDQSKPPPLVGFINACDVSSDIDQPVDRLIRLDVECQPRAGRGAQSGEHRHGRFPCPRLVGSDGGLGGSRKFRKSRLRQPGLCPRPT